MADLRKMLPDLLPLLLEQWPDALADHRVFEIGLSGGLDSMVLLDLVARAREYRSFSLLAVHVHHGLSADADCWVHHCQIACEQRGIGLRVAPVHVLRAGGRGLEAEARKVRYRVYSTSPAQVIVLAHHQDDQVETVLLQLLRGGGVRALAAMPVLRQWQQKYLWRPLLLWPRGLLTAYAQWRRLTWVEDESNTDTRRRRNLLRHQILPQLATAIPDYRSHLVRSAWLMSEAGAVLAEVVEKDWDDCSLSLQALDIERFLQLSPARQRQLLVFWIEKMGCSVATPEAVESFRTQVVTAAPDRNPTLALGSAVLFRYRQQLGFSRMPTTSPAPLLLKWPWPGGSPSGWPGTLRFIRKPRAIEPRLLMAGFTLMPLAGGERLLTAIGKKPVKTLLQEHGVPPIFRTGWPLLLLPNGQLAALPDIAVAIDCQAEAGDGWWPQWIPD